MRKPPRQQWKFPILPTLLSLGVDPSLTEYRSARTKVLCPFHADTRPSAVVDWAKQRFRCFACDVSGDAVDLWQSQEGLTREAARTRAEEISGGRDFAVSGTPGVRELSLFD